MPQRPESEQHALEAALRESEERLRLAVDAGQVGIWDWDIVHDRVTWSDQVYAMHGMERGSFGGRVEHHRSLIHPDDAARVGADLQRALAAGDTYVNEFRTRLHDGSVRWISTRARIVRNPDGKAVRMVGASSDITARMELLDAEREARASAERARRRLEILAGAGNELSRSLEEHATLMAIARAIVPTVADWCRIDLLDEHGTMQRKVAHHTDPAKAAQAMEMVTRLRAAPGAKGSMGWAAQTGEDYHGVFAFPDELPGAAPSNLRLFTETFGMHAYYILPLMARGRILGSMAVIQAESGRELGERDRALVMQLAQRAALALDNARLYAEAGRARLEAERANRAKDAFLAMLGHELRNPLAPIASALELLRSGGSQQAAAPLRVIERQVAHLGRLVDDLLDVSRVASGKVRLDQAGLDMADVIAQALELAQPRLDASAHAVTLEIGVRPARVRGDAQRLVQVTGNLLSNAAKFTPPSGSITISLRRAGTAIELAVQDSGVGMAPELLSSVFDAFVQAEQPIDRQAGGLGLGLTIARAMVEQHGGTIAAHSEGPGKGSRFTIRLPEDLSFETARATEPAPPQSPSAGVRVLLVDDNRDALDTLTELLRMRRYDARSAIDGPAALEVVRNFTPDVALLDVGLPGMDGYELARRLREQAGGRPLKLVALTGYGGEADRERAFAAGFHEHLVKPVSVDRLLQVLAKL